MCAPFQATDKFFTLYEALAEMQTFTEITVNWCKLEETDRAIGPFAAHTVPIVALSGVGAKKFWPPPRRPAPKLPPRRSSGDRASAGEEDALPDGNVLSGDDDDDADLLGSGDEGDDEADAFGDLEGLLETLREDADNEAEANTANAEEAANAAVQPAPDGAPNAELMGEGEPAPEPPEAVDADGAAPAGARSKATVVYHVYGGAIAYYPSKVAFEAVCNHPGHGRCVVTRTARGKPGRGGLPPMGGRPVGFLAGWLRAGQDLPDKTAHWRRCAFERSHEERMALRNTIASTPDGRRLLSFERPAADGEGAEPATVAPLLPAASKLTG